MGPSQLLARLGMDVRSNRHHATFANAQTAEPAIAAFLSPGEVQAFLEDAAPEETYQMRESVVRSLLRLHQHDASGYWASVLLVAFAPMLVSLRAQIRGGAFDAGELDQIVVEGFLLAIAVQQADQNCDRIAMRMRQRTREYVFGRLVAKQQTIERQRELERRAKGHAFFELYSWKVPARLTESERSELAELLRVIAVDAPAPERLDMIAATPFQGMPLRAYLVSEVGTVDNIEVALGRLKREHSRTLVKLRELLVRGLAATRAMEDSLGSSMAQAS